MTKAKTQTIKTADNKLPEEVENALDLVRAYQVMKFVSGMDKLSPECLARVEYADEALKSHGNKKFTYTADVKSFVLLASVLSRMSFTDHCPELDEVKFNFIRNVVSTISTIHVGLVSIALGATPSRYHIPVTARKD